MKILYFVTAFPVRSETFVLNQISGMIKRGHDVKILAKNGDQSTPVPIEFNKYNLLQKTVYSHRSANNKAMRLIEFAFKFFSSRHCYRLSTLKLLVRAMRKLDKDKQFRLSQLSQLNVIFTLFDFQPDVVHCQFGTLGPFVANLKQQGLIDAPLIVSFRGYDATRYAKENPDVYTELFRVASLFLPVSKTLQHAIETLGCPHNKIEIHHSGIDSQKWQYKKLSLPKNDQFVDVLTVARLVEKKGVMYSIRSVAKLIALGHLIRYKIIGGGILIDELRQLVVDLGVTDQIILLGPKSHDQVLERLEKSHILIAPSITSVAGDQEGIPNSLKESMALGIPVMATQHGGIPELVEDGITGFLVPERDVDAMADKLKYMLANRTNWIRIGIAARAYIEDKFDIEKLNNRLEKIYHSSRFPNEY